MKERDKKIYLLSQFYDVLEVLEEYDNIEDIKKDITKRKKLLQKEMERLMKNGNR